MDQMGALRLWTRWGPSAYGPDGGPQLMDQMGAISFWTRWGPSAYGPDGEPSVYGPDGGPKLPLPEHHVPLPEGAFPTPRATKTRRRLPYSTREARLLPMLTPLTHNLAALDPFLVINSTSRAGQHGFQMDLCPTVSKVLPTVGPSWNKCCKHVCPFSSSAMSTYD